MARKPAVEVEALTSVRLLVSLTGTRDGIPWPAIGEVVELPAVEAAQYAALGYVAEA